MNLEKKKKRFLELIEPLMQNLESFAIAMAGSRDIAKDLVSETVLTAWQQFDSLRSEEAFLSYLFTICRRAYYADKKYKLNEIACSEEEIDAMFKIELNVDDKLDLQYIFVELGKLDPEIKEAVILHYVNGLQHNEIAQIQDKSVNAVKMSIYRAKNTVRKNLRINTDQSIGGEKNER